MYAICLTVDVPYVTCMEGNFNFLNSCWRELQQQQYLHGGTVQVHGGDGIREYVHKKLTLRRGAVKTNVKQTQKRGESSSGRVSSHAQKQKHVHEST